MGRVGVGVCVYVVLCVSVFLCLDGDMSFSVCARLCVVWINGCVRMGVDSSVNEHEIFAGPAGEAEGGGGAPSGGAAAPRGGGRPIRRQTQRTAHEGNGIPSRWKQWLRRFFVWEREVVFTRIWDPVDFSGLLKLRIPAFFILMQSEFAHINFFSGTNLFVGGFFERRRGE